MGGTCGRDQGRSVAAKDFPDNEPLLRTGEMRELDPPYRDREHGTHRLRQRQSGVWQELGTKTIPPALILEVGRYK